MRLPNATAPALNGAEVRGFVEQGFLVARGMFPRRVCERALPQLWRELGMDPDDSATWTGPAVMLREILEDPPLHEILTPRYRAVVDHLCGVGRWETTKGIGWWPILFPGFARPPWRPPVRGWHLDHNADPIRLGSPERGLSSMEYFTDIGPGDGGTAVREGSHRRIARMLAEAEPTGLTNRVCVDATADMLVVEMTGEAGDVIFMHPLTVHASSVNTSDRVRIAANRPFWLREPMNLAREDLSDHSVVETAIVHAIGRAAAVPSRAEA